MSAPFTDGAGVVLGDHGPTMQLRSGPLVPVLAPDPAMIQIADIAAALSKLCRFTGHTRAFYSVAQHSVLVSQIVPPEHAMWGLLHDAAEAYVGDIARPLKVALERAAPGVLAGIEEGWQRAVAERFGLCWPMPEAIHHADRVMLATERRDLMAAGPDWPDMPEPRPGRLWDGTAGTWMPWVAELRFLDRFRTLGGGLP